MWLPFSTGSTEDSLGPTGTQRIFIASITESEVGHQIEHFTVMRQIFNLSMLNQAAGQAFMNIGTILLQEDVALASILPDGDPGADWLWHEQFSVTNDRAAGHINIFRDVRSQRIARGNDTELYMIIKNRDSTNTVDFSASGRVLVLL